MVYTLIDKAIYLSDKEFQHNTINLVKHLLRINSYPDAFIKFHVNKRVNILNSKLNSNNININIENTDFCATRNSFTICIPYIKDFFEKVKLSLKPFNITLLPIMSNTLNNIIKRGKDKNDPLDSPNVVYQINCKNCDASYVGESKLFELRLEVLVKKIYFSVIRRLRHNPFKNREEAHDIVAH